MNKESKGIHLKCTFGLGIKCQYTNSMKVGVLSDFHFVSQGVNSSSPWDRDSEKQGNNGNQLVSCRKASPYLIPAEVTLQLNLVSMFTLMNKAMCLPCMARKTPKSPLPKITTSKYYEFSL